MTSFLNMKYESLLKFGGRQTCSSPSHREGVTLVHHRGKNLRGILPMVNAEYDKSDESFLEQIAILAPSFPEWLGNRSFLEKHQLRFAYVGGAMARGIASAELVIQLAKHGMMGFFGSAGLSLRVVEEELKKIERSLGPDKLPFGANLIHTPEQADLERNIVELYLKHDVRKISASAFMKMTPSIVYYGAKGLSEENGLVKRRQQIFAKISRIETAQQFMNPPSEKILQSLLNEGLLNEKEVALARKIPVATNIIIESDSGGPTDNRPLGSLFPAIQDLRNRVQKQRQYQEEIFLGAAGGMGTPNSIASAFSLGADFVVIGSVHQACVESGLSHQGKQMLAEAGVADIAMTPSADMFQLGVKVQVLKRGTMMAPRGSTLYQLYRDYDSMEDIPEEIRLKIEKDLFRMPLSEVWAQTKSYFQDIEPEQIKMAEDNPKHKMALVFRWYLGKSSQWPIQGTDDRKFDYQIWCGPAMGAFNQWTKGTFLESPDERKVGQVALNLMEGAAAVFRWQQLRSMGYAVPSENFLPEPQRLGV